MLHDTNQFELLNHLCTTCNLHQCFCSGNNLGIVKVSQDCELSSISELNSSVYDHVIVPNITEYEQSLHSIVYGQSSPCTVHTVSLHSTNDQHCHPVNLTLCSKGINMGHLNIQGTCGEKLGKFSEIQALLTSPENYNLHVFGLSETKLKAHKLNSVFQINGFQTPFRKDNCSNGGGGLIVYVRNSINARRREDLETNDIPCLMLEISPTNSRPFLVGNMYRPPNATVDFNDRFEDFIDVINQEDKELFLLGDFNKKVLNEVIDRNWGNFTTSLGLSQLVSEPTRVTKDSATLIDHIYTNSEENIQCVNVKKLCLSDHYAVFCNRKCNSVVGKNAHQVINYRSFKNLAKQIF